MTQLTEPLDRNPQYFATIFCNIEFSAPDSSLFISKTTGDKHRDATIRVYQNNYWPKHLPRQQHHHSYSGVLQVAELRLEHSANKSSDHNSSARQKS
jgi:hypothetical protein